MPSLGPMLGEGRTAEVFEFGEGRVIKLMLPGFSERALRREAEKTAAAVESGAPAPRVYGMEEADGRPGIVFGRADGTLMLDLILGAPHRARKWGRLLAQVHASVLGRETEDLPDVREFLASKISDANGLSANERKRAKNALVQLPGGRNLLHGDFHPLNVYLDGESATVIDWLDATRGVVAADLARSLWLTSVNVIPPDFPRRRAVVVVARLMAASYRRSILRLTKLGVEDIERWTLPVLAGRLSEGIEHEEPLLVQEVRSRL